MHSERFLAFNCVMCDSTNIVLLFIVVIASVPRIDPAPNIVFILADDLGWNDVGFHGSTQVKTPEIDSMANDGIILNNYYVMPLCTPSRAALMTGRHPVRLGLQYYVILAGQRLGLPLNYKILPQYLNDMGYESHAIGKWHLGFFHKNYTPTYRGFKTFYGYYSGKGDYFDHRDQETEPDWFGLDWHFDEEGNLTNVDTDFGVYSPVAITRRVQSIIDTHDFNTKPLFLYVAFQNVHAGNDDDPIQVPTETEYQFENIWNVKRRKYVGVVNELDKAIGRIRNMLEEKDIMKDTIVVFSTDNGGPTNGFNKNWANNFPLRGGKSYFYEGGARGAAFVYGDMFERRRGGVSKGLMHITDWLPTLFEAAGGRATQLEDLDGFSMWDLLTGQNMTSPRSEVLINMDPEHDAAAIKVGNYKYLLNPRDGYSSEFDNWFRAPGKFPDTNETVVAATTPSQVYCGETVPPLNVDTSCYSRLSGKMECLFDLETDPCEFYNLIDNENYEDIKAECEKRLEYWKSVEVPPMCPPIDHSANPNIHGYVWGPWTNDTNIPEGHTCIPP